MTDLDRQLVRTALKHMIKQGYFSICDFDNCTNIAKVLVPSEIQVRLRIVHCVRFSDMTPEVRQFIHDNLERFFGEHILEDPKPQLEVVNIQPKKPKWKLLGGK